MGDLFGEVVPPQVLEIPIEITVGPVVGRSEIFLRAKKRAWVAF